MSYFENTQNFKTIVELFNNKKIIKNDEIRKIEGSQFGCPLYGWCDHIINFLQRLLFRYHKEHKKMSDLFKILEDTQIDNCLIQIILSLGQKSDISPRGMVYLLILIHDTIYSDFKSFSQKFYKEQVITSLCQILKE